MPPRELLRIEDEEQLENILRPRMYSSSHHSLFEHIAPYFYPHLLRALLRANLQTAHCSSKRKNPPAVPLTRQVTWRTQKSSLFAGYLSSSSVPAASKRTTPRISSLSQGLADGTTPVVCERAGMDPRHLAADQTRARDRIDAEVTQSLLGCRLDCTMTQSLVWAPSFQSHHACESDGRPLPPGLVPLVQSPFTGSSNGAGITIDVLNTEPPREGDGWRSLLGGFLGASAGSEPSEQRTSFGTPQVIHQGNPLVSERGSLQSMRSHLSPYSARSSSGSAPTSLARVFNLSGSNSSRPSLNSGQPRVATTALRHTYTSQDMSHITEEFEDQFVEPSRMSRYPLSLARRSPNQQSIL
ncbi:hypothetical protein BDR07DRAFT_1481444 [Suillus spraguei]|nr:hypothetical protein BDR07DRAFT_1481444 [Suillus spraguei]